VISEENVKFVLDGYARLRELVAAEVADDVQYDPGNERVRS
jgi:hypothetical protein